MSFIAAAVIGAGAIGAIGSIVSSGQQASADQQAANTQQNMFNTIVGQEQPYMSAGNSATSTLSQLLGTAAPTGNNGTAGNTGLQGGYLTQPSAARQITSVRPNYKNKHILE